MKPEIRVLALGLIKTNQQVFLSEGYDPKTDSTFYRALGGGVDFGETSLAALKREFMEEIQAELDNIEYLGCLENIFEFNGKAGHELIQLYQCDFVDPKFYELERLTFSEGNHKKDALWVDMAACQSGQLRVVPEEFLAFL